jgi:hypothetical protein
MNCLRLVILQDQKKNKDMTKNNTVTRSLPNTGNTPRPSTPTPNVPQSSPHPKPGADQPTPGPGKRP